MLNVLRYIKFHSATKYIIDAIHERQEGIVDCL